MRVVVQRVMEARVRIGGETVGQIRQGLMLLVGIKKGDTAEDMDYVADKIVGLRIFEDGEGKMNRSIQETGGEILSVSQFTLYGDTSHGRRPSFIEAARPDQAEPLYEAFNARLRSRGVTVSTGRFGAMMAVSLINDGPVTLIIESKRH
ncbi:MULTISPECIES: D-aminoacyl-tRNA deacylase [unclassified Sporolactobacillus]|uniref:D-aminoacyl-tRNA deacylase n=1 Tax=unclassified Sporolactobacillus TaxID=2628533 RepID=UPI002367FC30|nr:D-aminoacyl-tRNA deacylase [Sporolactobacillus sp. CQH2019]MDD9147663.1 D-aminoacyl-tRNA deacylase [Sporolactobacillus sp. CQH2019]